jgi:Predicted integral membrane protein
VNSCRVRPPLLVRRLLPAVNPFLALTVLVAASLLVAATVFYPYDTLMCWLPWAEASGGWRPWAIYAKEPSEYYPVCNYPPFFLYILTLIERLRLILNAPSGGLLAVCLVKLFVIAAHAAGVLVVYFGMCRPFGGKTARRAALLYALSLPLFVNGAMWGQADTVLLLAMVSALVALAADRPLRAGALMGWALSIKLQAVCIAPALLVYTWRRFGWRATLLGTAAGLGVLALITAPFVLAGEGEKVLAAYKDAAGFYHLRSLNAWNLWNLANDIDIRWRGVPGSIANQDDRLAFGPLTYQHVGILMFAAYLLLVLVVLWRRARRETLLDAAALSAVGFFILCTQMHERYIVPGAALLTLTGALSLTRLTVAAGFGLTAFLNQVLVLYSNYLPYAKRPTNFVDWCWGFFSMPMTVLNLALFAAATTAYLWPGEGEEAQAPRPPAPPTPSAPPSPR